MSREVHVQFCERLGLQCPGLLTLVARSIRVLAVVALVSSAIWAHPSNALQQITLFVEGDSSVIPKFVSVCREKGPEQGLDFKFVDKQSDNFDYRVVLSAEGSSAWDFAHGNIVVMNSDAKVLFTVTRSSRWTSKGTTNALAKEFVKTMAKYLDAHK